MSAAMQREIVPDGPSLGRAALERVVAAASQAAAANRAFHVALSGGSTPKALYALMAADGRIDWSQVHLWFGDERAVPPDHPDSNYRMAREALLDRLALPADRVHRIRGESSDLDAEAARFGRELTEALPSAGGWPTFDLMLQGIGTDGHTASLFPGTGAVSVRDRAALHVKPLPYVRPAVERVSVTAPVIQAAREVLVLVAGADKAPLLPTLLDGPVEVETYPSQLLRSASGPVTWLIDAAAAAKL